MFESIDSFMQHCVRLSDDERPYIPASKLYESYRVFCTATGADPATRVSFVRYFNVAIRGAKTPAGYRPTYGVRWIDKKPVRAFGYLRVTL